jgi:hypothetical protein
MRDKCKRAFCTGFDKVLRSPDESSARIGHIIDQDRDFTGHMTNEYHPANFVGLFPFFVEQRELDPKPVSDRRRSRRDPFVRIEFTLRQCLNLPFGSAGIWRDNDTFAHV